MMPVITSSTSTGFRDSKAPTWPGWPTKACSWACTTVAIAIAASKGAATAPTDFMG